jgi:hypothetical protein
VQQARLKLPFKLEIYQEHIQIEVSFMTEIGEERIDVDDRQKYRIEVDLNLNYCLVMTKTIPPGEIKISL